MNIRAPIILLCMTCLLPVKTNAASTNDIFKELLLSEASVNDIPLHQQVESWRKKASLSPEDIFSLDGELINDIFLQNKAAALTPKQRLIGMKAIVLLRWYHADDNKTRDILQRLILQDMFKTSRTVALATYLDLYGRQILTDSFINEIMTTDNDWVASQRILPFGYICRQYEAYPLNQQKKALQLIFDWSQQDANWGIYYEVDVFLVKHQEGYRQSTSRKTRLEKFLVFLDQKDVFHDNQVYDYVTNALRDLKTLK
ncbi:MAG: hypothetical protein PHQ27_02885 [Victivallales bacterium]|nr:hypothetical protein [Victivallales bacterium]